MFNGQVVEGVADHMCIQLTLIADSLAHALQKGMKDGVVPEDIMTVILVIATER